MSTRKYPFGLKKTTILIAVPGVFIVLALALMTAIFLLEDAEEHAADRLPLQAMAGYFHGITRADTDRLKERFPVLSNVPAPQNAPVDVGILRRQDGTYGWAMFLGGNLAKAISSRGPLDTTTLVVRTSSEDITKLLTMKPEEPLSSSPAFRTLAAEPPAGPWAFLDSRLLLPTEQDADNATANLLGSPFVLLAWDKQAATLRFLSPSARPSPDAPDLPRLTPPPSLVLSAARGGDAWTALHSLLPAASRATLDGTVMQAVRTTLGEDVSLRYDLLPLLSGASTVVFRTSATGTDVLIMGSTTPATAAALPRIHASARARLTTFRIDRRSLPHDFRAVTIQDDPSLVTGGDEQVSGFAVRGTWRTDTANLGLWTAVRGNAVAISSRRDWLIQALDLNNALIVHDATLALQGESGVMRSMLEDTFGWNVPSLLLRSFAPQGSFTSLSVHTGPGIVTIRAGR